MKKAFELFDKDGSNSISFDNLRQVAYELGENISDDELREMIHMACKDRYGEVSQSQFEEVLNPSQ